MFRSVCCFFLGETQKKKDHFSLRNARVCEVLKHLAVECAISLHSLLLACLELRQTLLHLHFPLLHRRQKRFVHCLGLRS